MSEEEDVTREEIQEEHDFIDSIVDTKVMEITMEFLVSKNLISDDKMTFKRLLHRMWFALYPRSRRTIGSCAFEHIFLGIVEFSVASCTVWKFQDFSVIQILREINFGDSRSSKIAVFAI